MSVPASRWLYDVLLPLSVGGAIYVLFRPDTLLGFRWLRSIGLGPLIASMRRMALPAMAYIPTWCLMSLPAGLYSYAFVRSVALVWSQDSSRARRWWIGGVAAAAISAEFGQAVGVFPGRFSLVDLLVDGVAVGMALLVTSLQRS